MGKFLDVCVNVDLFDLVDFFKYFLVYWVCVLGKFKVLEKLVVMKEFDLGVKFVCIGEIGLYWMFFFFY